MNTAQVFMNRRSGHDRREDQHKHAPADELQQEHDNRGVRSRGQDRRSQRDLAQDYYAFVASNPMNGEDLDAQSDNGNFPIVCESEIAE